MLNEAMLHYAVLDVVMWRSNISLV